MIDLFPEDERDRGVSPVIGVILMVAITVILAAVIGTFVLGLSDSVNEQASAGVSVEADTSSTSIVTITSIGDNAKNVSYVNESGAYIVGTGPGESLTVQNGGAVIAYGEEGVESKTLQTNVGN